MHRSPSGCSIPDLADEHAPLALLDPYEAGLVPDNVSAGLLDASVLDGRSGLACLLLGGLLAVSKARAGDLRCSFLDSMRLRCVGAMSSV